jgi:hypothetical protein
VRARLGPTDREILGLAVPALGSLAIDPLLTLADTAFVARLGTVELAALGVDAAILSLAFFAFNFLSFVTTPLVAKSLGRGDANTAKDYVATGAMVGTGQARPGESVETHELLGASITAMLGSALTVRASVPATLQLVQVASGRMEAFWQFSQVRSGLLAGALLVAEAGGTVTDAAGRPWTLNSPHFLAAAGAMHPRAIEVLAGLVSSVHLSPLAKSQPSTQGATRS